MHSFILQDWVTIQTSGYIAQPAAGWLRLGPFENLALYLDIRQGSFAGAPTPMSYETSPTKRESSFVPLIPPFAVTIGTQTQHILAAYGGVLPGHYLRWRFVTPDGVNATFRILGVASSRSRGAMWRH